MKASFDSAAAVAYAYKYWSSYNTSYPDYSANGGGVGLRQLRLAGTQSWWYTSKTNHSFAWAAAQGYAGYLTYHTMDTKDKAMSQWIKDGYLVKHIIYSLFNGHALMPPKTARHCT